MIKVRIHYRKNLGAIELHDLPKYLDLNVTAISETFSHVKEIEKEGYIVTNINIL
jgi:hypothetical protein